MNEPARPSAQPVQVWGFPVRYICSILLLAALTSNSVLAQPSGPPTDDIRRQAAHQHFDRGLDLASRYDYAQALQEFLEAYRLSPHFAVKYNIGQTYIALGLTVEAVAALEQYLAAGKDEIPTERAQQVLAQIAAERALIAEVTFTVNPPGATIQIDGREIGHAPLAESVRVAAGRHLISVNAPDGTQLSRPVMLQGTEQLALTFELPAIAPPGKQQTATEGNRSEFTARQPKNSTAHDAYEPESSMRITTLGYALGIAGLALGGAAFGDYLWNRHRFEQWKSTHAELQANQQAPDYPQR
jgi:tetratricopeptide (TPR) repeat protein